MYKYYAGSHFCCLFIFAITNRHFFLFLLLKMGWLIFFATLTHLTSGTSGTGGKCNTRKTEGDKIYNCLMHDFDSGSLYNGRINVTVTGKDCLRWQKPVRAHAFVRELVDGKSRMVAGNFCRNGGRGTPKGEIPKRNKVNNKLLL